MANNVFANTREISCKKADGKTVCAFPDVCLTPPPSVPSPFGPGVPVPYPNTGMAKDTSNGTRSVKITGKEIIKKNVSYYKTSYGDEAGTATPAKKGIITGTTKGKVYFTTWSMDVKFEGKNVVRHMDLTTHNHNSQIGNESIPWLHVDTMAITVDGIDDPCEGTRNNVKEKCAEPLKNNTYSTGRINKTGLKRDMCKNKDCKKAMKCVLVPYDFGCCDGKTGHHVIPAHCFMPPGERSNDTGKRYKGCEKYDVKKAPCICVSGKDKSNKRKQHARLHKHFDAAEDAHKNDDDAGTWSYEQASEAGAESVERVMKCDKKCTQAQLDSYHCEDSGIDKNTQLRADSGGRSTPPDLEISTPKTINT